MGGEQWLTNLMWLAAVMALPKAMLAQENEYSVNLPLTYILGVSFQL